MTFFLFMIGHASFDNLPNCDDEELVVLLSDLTVRGRLRSSLCKQLTDLRLIEKSPSGSSWKLKIADQKLHKILISIDYNSSESKSLHEQTRFLLGPRVKKLKGEHWPTGCTQESPVTLMSELQINHNGDGIYCTSPNVSISGLAAKSGLQVQSLRKQIKEPSFPYHYLPGGTVSPLGKFGSVFIKKRIPVRHSRYFTFASDTLNIQISTLRRFWRLPAEQRELLISHLGKEQREDNSLKTEPGASAFANNLTRIALIAPFGLKLQQLSISKRNITARLLSLLPYMWGARTDGEKTFQENESYPDAEKSDKSKERLRSFMIEHFEGYLKEQIRLRPENSRADELSPLLIRSMAKIVYFVLIEIEQTLISFGIVARADLGKVDIKAVLLKNQQTVTDLTVYYAIR